MINPEFRRNLWLSFSMHRLIAMPALLGLVFLTAAFYGSASSARNLYSTATVLFTLIVCLWGSINANSAIIEELRDKTWDQQCMSALDPWTMTWGKLFGATSFNWYGGAICLVVLALSGITANRSDWLLDLLNLIAIGILLHATVIALNLHTARFETNLIRRGGMGWIVIVFAYLLFQTLAFPFLISSSSVLWWGMTIGSQKVFMLGSALLFMVCAIFAAWRLMSNALQVRTLPWAWPLFVLILSAYYAGFSSKTPFSFVGFFIAAALSYATLLTESNSLLIWNKLRLRWQAKNWRGFLADLPLWPTTLLLAFLFAPMADFTSRAGDGATMLFAMALLLLRDACIILFFSFAPNARRPVVVAVLYIIVLDFLLPFLFKSLGLQAIAYFLNPGSRMFFSETYGSDRVDLLIAGIHAAVALGFVAWRIHESKRREAGPQPGIAA
ncbi:MAG: hypothetical protein LBE81_09095 [Azonexus sp.]|jgi:hypothetical protein|uniref:hypothetical protein n=1 Tax=Azonexus sp. TaxID=1872668 RepID=UPI00283500CC|nr:hypothetical protein [Azonexus sp.]MDR0776777.1 hypothetical protein [Azonexus sp.]